LATSHWRCATDFGGQGLRKPCNGAVTANVPASTEDSALPEIISRYPDLTSLLSADTFSGPCSDVSYFDHFKITGLNCTESDMSRPDYAPMQHGTIYTAINFTRLSVTTEVGALCGRLICGWLGVVVARKADPNWKL